jgi:hypothetical protein
MNRFRIGDADGDPGTSTPYKETPKRLLEMQPCTGPSHDSSRYAPHSVQLADE